MPLKFILSHFRPTFFSLVGTGVGLITHYCNPPPATSNTYHYQAHHHCHHLLWWVAGMVGVNGGCQFTAPVGGRCGHTRHYRNPIPAITINLPSSATVHHCHYLLWWLAAMGGISGWCWCWGDGSNGWQLWVVMVKIFFDPNELKSPKNNMSFYYFFLLRGGGSDP